MFMYLEIIFSTKTQFKSFNYIPNSMHSLKNSPFCDILGDKIIYKVKPQNIAVKLSFTLQEKQI